MSKRSRPTEEPTGGPAKASWSLEQGEEIVPGRLALKQIGGGRHFETYLA
jgi:hypothetical protein